MLGETISHYRILEKLGQGGMGDVYLAEDPRLGRKVALKFLAPDLARDRESLVRFRNEARAAAELSHPNIATIHDIGEVDGKPFLVLEYVQGQTLRQRIAQGPLPIEEVLRISNALAAGLAEAHSHGIVHRDVKSANIMLTAKGDVKILDFGLAHRSNATQLTRRGTTLGTVGYMSPEQAAGQTADARSDLWSLGVVIYECLTGTLPFSGDSAQAILYCVQTQSVTPPSSLRTDIPIVLEQITLRCLDKDPSLRFQHASEIASELLRNERDAKTHRISTSASKRVKNRILSRRSLVQLIILGIVIATVGLITIRRWGGSPPDTVAGYAITVMPFEVLGSQEDSKYLGRALAEAIAVNLAPTKSLHVLPVPQLSAESESARQAAGIATTGASTMLRLTGSITHEAAPATMSAQLVDVSENRLLWGTQSTFESGSLARTAVDLAEQLASHLGFTQVHRYEYFRYVKPSPQMAQWPLLIETVAALETHNVDRGLPLTERLIEDFPLEYSAHVMRLTALIDNNDFANNSLQSRAALEQGVESLERIDPRAPILAIASTFDSADHGRNVQILDGLVERDDLTPSCRAHALRTRGRESSYLGRHVKAMQDLNDALSLDPANPYSYSYLADVLEQSGTHDEALMRRRQCMALMPALGAYDLALHFGRLGQRDDALQYLARALESGLKGQAWRTVDDFTFLHGDPGFVSLIEAYAAARD